MSAPLGQTAERVIDGVAARDEREWIVYLLHLATYKYCGELVAPDARLLDLGCGSGYGSAWLASRVREVAAVDLSSDAIAHARQHHGAPNLDFAVIGPLQPGSLPYRDGEFDAVFSLQVIEHVHDLHSYLREIHRVLRPGGVALFATPDRRGRLLPWQKPWNRFHVTEFDPAGLVSVIRPVFPQVELLYMTASARVRELERSRYRRRRWLALPVTFAAVPESLRQRALGGLEALQRRRARTSTSSTGAAAPFAAREEDIVVTTRDPRPAINLLARVVR